MVVSSVTPLMPSRGAVPWRSSVQGALAARRSRGPFLVSSSAGAGTLPAFSNSHPCAPAGWRRRRRPGSCWGRRRPASSGPARCTTSTPPGSRPSRRKPGCLRRRSRRRRGPGWRRCCRSTQRTWAPSSTRVSISTAVWMVMCRLPVMRAPVRGLLCRISRAEP